MSRVAAALVLCLAACAVPGMAYAQLEVPANRSPRAKPPAKTAENKEESKPTWAELSPAQQQALRPLGASWTSLAEAHKRKWIALSRNFAKMPPQEQALLHSRMTEWAALSPQQRTQARLNFAESKKVAPNDKKAMWEAYQQLPPEEKKKLAAGANAQKPPPPPTAAAVKPVPKDKLAKVPPRKSNPRAPGIAVAPNQVDTNTLLPQPGVAAPFTPN
jgi:hypothetical protein